MKRKIAAILAADVAGYSRLVAEDEEETLRRLASYRSVIDDFIARAGGRIFNTAGDAVLAEFSSSVEAVRCAVDIQESLRTRNLAYPQSRQMHFRIGITVGDVVERDGDLLGDGVNIAARLEGLAEVGGICVSRAVHEQVANKLSVQFADIGEQQVKNIPNPVHAYKVALGGVMPIAVKAGRGRMPALIASVAGLVAAIAAGAIVWRLLLPALPPQEKSPTSISTGPQATANSGTTNVAPQNLSPAAPAPAPAAAPRPAEAQPSVAAASAPRGATSALNPDAVPMVSDQMRRTIRDFYLPAEGPKALAISPVRIGFMTGQKDEAAARAAALDACQRATDAAKYTLRKCEVYAVNNNVVHSAGIPPLPQPLFQRNAAIERPLVPSEIPLLREELRAGIERSYVPAVAGKAIAVGPRGGMIYYYGQSSTDEAIRRSLELCGYQAGLPCMIVAIDNHMVVPVPTAHRATGFFRAGSHAAIAPEARDIIQRQLADATNGWSAVAAGQGGRAGASVNRNTEAEATEGALAACRSRDEQCRVIAIGPFTVEPR